MIKMLSEINLKKHTVALILIKHQLTNESDFISIQGVPLHHGSVAHWDISEPEISRHYGNNSSSDFLQQGDDSFSSFAI